MKTLKKTFYYPKGIVDPRQQKWKEINKDKIEIIAALTNQYSKTVEQTTYYYKETK